MSRQPGTANRKTRRAHIQQPQRGIKGRYDQVTAHDILATGMDVRRGDKRSDLMEAALKIAKARGALE